MPATLDAPTMFPVAELVRRLDKRTMRIVLRALQAKDAPELSREDFAAAARMMSGSPARGDHAKALRVYMAWIGAEEAKREAFESYVKSRGREEHANGRRRKTA